MNNAISLLYTDLDLVTFMLYCNHVDYKEGNIWLLKPLLQPKKRPREKQRPKQPQDLQRQLLRLQRKTLS